MNFTGSGKIESRQTVLNAIRRHTKHEVSLPSLEGQWTTYDDSTGQFSNVLEAAGGRCLLAKDMAEVNRRLEELTAYSEAKKVCSLVPDIARANVDLDSIDDPHDLEDVDFAVLPAQFGVAENGAVWMTDDGMRHRVIPFIVQHLAFVLPVGAIIDNMSQAYERLSFSQPGFGCFISGPSKTADIEQSLVVGAHGPRSLAVFLVED